jgi:hypothetical protein
MVPFYTTLLWPYSWGGTLTCVFSMTLILNTYINLDIIIILKMICPLISTCKAKVDADKYLNVCSNISVDAYKNCDEYKKQTMEAKTPSDWAKLFAPGLPTVPPTPPR